MAHDILDDAPHADKISGWCCKHGTVTLELFNRDGSVLARAYMPYAAFKGMSGEIRDDAKKHNIQTELH